MITREFNLNLHAGHSIPLVINASQYDRGEQWVFTLLNSDGTQYSPNAAAIAGTKSDGNLIVNAATVDSDGRVVVSETEQMTAAAGKAKFELLLDDQTHGTANFVVLVEASPADEGVPSASDLSLIQQAIDGTSPTAIAAGVSAWMSEHLTPTTPVVDASLTVQGAAADAKKTGDELNDLKSEISQSAGLTADIKQALMNCFNYVAWKDDDPNAQTYIDALEDALYPPVNLSSISAVYTQSGTVYNTDTLDTLKSDLVVTAHYSDGTSGTVTEYALSGTLAVGTSTITVTYGGKTATFTVTVTKAQLIPDGTYTFASTGETVTITNGNHFAISLKANASASSNGNFINLSDLTKNGEASSAQTNNVAVNNLSDVLYTFPAQASVTLKLLNPTLNRTDVVKDGSLAQLVISFRKTGDVTTVIAGGVGFPLSSQGGGNKFENTVTIATTTNASCLFLYYAYVKDAIFEFDLEMTVNGEKVI